MAACSIAKKPTPTRCRFWARLDDALKLATHSHSGQGTVVVAARANLVGADRLRILRCRAFDLLCGAGSGRTWLGPFNPHIEISRDPTKLPVYAAYSLLRITVAYVLSLAFTLVYGYVAAYNPRAERIMIPLLDILQSIPVLSFLPGVMLAMVALFPGPSSASSWAQFFSSSPARSGTWPSASTLR